MSEVSTAGAVQHADRHAAPESRPATSRRSVRPRDAYGLMVLPALALAAVGILYPVALSLWNSLTKSDGGQNAYAWLWENPVYMEILMRTFSTALLTVLLCLGLGYPFAYLMAISGPKVRAMLIAFTLFPFWISGLVRTFAWVIIFQKDGPLATMAPMLFGDGLLRTAAAVQIGLVQVLLPFMVLPLFNVMKGIDMRLVAAAESLGARPLVAFGRVFLPLSLPGIFAGSLVVFVMTLGYYVLPQMLGSSRQALIGQAIFTQANDLNNLGRSGALSVILLVISLALLAVSAWGRRYLPGSRGQR